MASRVCLPQDSTDSMLDVPVMEAIQRRHSEVKLGSSQQLSTGNSGLAPPRSPELRRHSDVSPASIRELEKVRINTYTHIHTHNQFSIYSVIELHCYLLKIYYVLKIEIPNNIEQATIKIS